MGTLDKYKYQDIFYQSILLLVFLARVLDFVNSLVLHNFMRFAYTVKTVYSDLQWEHYRQGVTVDSLYIIRIYEHILLKSRIVPYLGFNYICIVIKHTIYHL
jgi:hypothetical protein